MRHIGLLLLFAGSAVHLCAQSYTLTTIAGIDGIGDGKPALSALLRLPMGTVKDVNGVIYIADFGDHRIRRVMANGNTSTVAGNGRAGFEGDDGPAVVSQLDGPTSVRLDGKGNLFVADYNNQRIRKIDLTTGIITTVVGNGQLEVSGDGGPATEAGVDPRDFELDTDGNIYVADASNHRIRKVTSSTGIITTVAGTTQGFSSTKLNFPTGITLDPQKNIYFVDANNLRVRKIDAITGTISTIAGTGFLGVSKSGPPSQAHLYYPLSIAYGASGKQLLVAGFAYVYLISATGDGNILVVGGSDDYGYEDGSAANAKWGDILGVSISPQNEAIVSDSTNYRIRRILYYDGFETRTNITVNPPITTTTSFAVVSTIAGAGITYEGTAGQTALNAPAGMALNGSGGLLFADRKFNIVRSLQAGQIKRVLGDGFSTKQVQRLNDPSGVARDSQGIIYIADRDNGRVLRVPLQGSPTLFTGGTGYGFDVTSAPAAQVPLVGPTAVILDGPGILYVADELGCRIRQIRNGMSNLIAGNGRCAFSGDNGPATQAGIVPSDIALDGKGAMYVADSLNNRIRRIDLTTGIITTIAGDGSPKSDGDGGLASAAHLWLPLGIAVDSSGRIAFAEYGTSTVRMIENNKIRTIAGTGAYLSNAESGTATAISFDPVRVLFDTNGDIFVSDEYNDRIRKLTPAVPATLQVTQGMNQSAAPGTKITVLVKVTEANGTPVGSLPVHFEVTSGAATLSAADSDTTNTGFAQVIVTLGATAGAVNVRATVAGIAPANIPMTVVAPTSTLDEGGVAGAGLSVPPIQAGSIGAIVAAFGKKLGPGAAFRSVTTADLIDGKMPTLFAGLCVDVAGVRAPIFGASDTLVNFLFPAVPLGTAAVSILTNCGTPQQQATNAVTIAVQSATPEFFYFIGSLDGHNPIATRDAITGALIGPTTLFPGSGMRPAKSGDLVTLYGTGFGDTTPPVIPGSGATGAAPTTGAVRVFFNGELLPAQDILYAGATPFSPGLYQLNIRVPLGLAAGEYTVVIEVGGIKSPPKAFLTVAP